MVRLEETIVVEKPIDRAFEYASHWENIATWDPGTAAATKTFEGPPHVGGVYDLEVLFMGRTSSMTYTITDMHHPTRLVVKGTGRTVDAVDTLTFLALDENSTEIHYIADLTFKGLARFLEPALRPSLDKLGKRAVRGLATHLSVSTA
ncbi:MAG: SRPBCC family protein [Acidimicrobiia bacterium]|nr:SRPBCC family protein [Acidimicrobiia bacterium]